MSEISLFEETSSYFADSILDHKIDEADLSLTAEENFKRKINKFRELFSRKNILKFGIMTGEEPIPSESIHGDIFVSTINTTPINERIKNLSETERKKIGYIHISTIQILIKSTFKKGIDAPLELILMDSRIQNKEQAIFAQGKCNLKHEKMKFDINLQIELSLRDKDLDRSIVFHYKLVNPKLMKEGNHPFIISYKINYALSNSIYSIDFKGIDTIHIDELFKPLITLESPIFINPARSSCSLIKAEENLFETEEKPLFRSQSLRIAPPKREFEISEQKETQKLQSSVA